MLPIGFLHNIVNSLDCFCILIKFNWTKFQEPSGIVMQWLALSAHSKSRVAKGFLCVFCMFLQHGFSTSTPNFLPQGMFIRLIGDCYLLVRVNSCLCVCVSPVADWWPVPGVHYLLSYDSCVYCDDIFSTVAGLNESKQLSKHTLLCGQPDIGNIVAFAAAVCSMSDISPFKSSLCDFCQEVLQLGETIVIFYLEKYLAVCAAWN